MKYTPGPVPTDPKELGAYLRRELAFISAQQLQKPLRPYTPVWTASGATQPSIGNGAIRAGYVDLGGWCITTVRVTFGSTTNPGSGSYLLSLPIPAALGYSWNGGAVLYRNPGNKRIGVTHCNSEVSNAAVFNIYADDFATVVANNTPFSWSAADALIATLAYATK